MILDHLLRVPSGGFVGVDVFFVISGFLITGQLLRDVHLTGRIRFRRFWLHRVRRILPAAILTIAVTVLAAALLVGPVRLRSIAGDAVWSALSVANWHFAIIGTDYSQADGPVSPLQHFWSLGVEEQFYVVWPVLIAVILLLAHRRPRIAIAVTLGCLAVASFLWAVAETSGQPTVAYFSTLSRAWELAAGAMLAVATPLLQSLHQTLRKVLAWAGLAMIVATAFVFTATTPFPGPWAAVPVAGAMLVIASGTGGPTWLWPLTNPVAGWIGDRSYSLYLWHYPAVILLAVALPAGSVRYVAAVLIVTLVCAMLSYRFVEEPIRPGRRPMGHGLVDAGAAARRSRQRLSSSRWWQRSRASPRSDPRQVGRRRTCRPRRVRNCGSSSSQRPTRRPGRATSRRRSMLLQRTRHRR